MTLIRSILGLIWLCIASFGGVFGDAVASQSDDLDQDYVIVPTIGFPIIPTLSQAQTFTVGKSGLMYQLELGLFRPDREPMPPLEVVVMRTYSNGFPNSQNILASVTLTYDQVTTEAFTTNVSRVVLSNQSFHVVEGELLAIALYTDSLSPSIARYFWYARRNDSFGRPVPPEYSFGHGYEGNPTSSAQYSLKAGTVDFNFRTYISEIPEPSALLLLTIGTFGVFARRP